MKTNTIFLKAEDGSRSNCADHFNIELSSKELNWSGVLMEKGTADYFHTENIISRDFLFSMELEKSFSWSASKGETTQEISTDPGNIWINPPMSPFTHSNDNPAKFLVLTVDKKVFLKNYDGYLPTEELVFLKDYSIQDEVICHIMKLFMLEVEAGGQNGNKYLSHLLKLLANYFIDNYSNLISLRDNKQLISSFSDKKVERVDKYIGENLSSTITIEDLASIFKMNKFTFLNEFKKHTGITPYQHIMSVKMKNAERLLTSSDFTLLEISLDLGFNDNSHFSKTFKRYYKVTPNQYRRSHKTTD